MKRFMKNKKEFWLGMVLLLLGISCIIIWAIIGDSGNPYWSYPEEMIFYIVVGACCAVVGLGFLIGQYISKNKD